jgi:hypothetical protein
MKRKFGDRADIWGEDTGSPMEGLANLADVMLVFVCGLLLSLVAFWNLDLNAATVKVGEDVMELEELSAEETTAFGDPEGYEELGVVYKDPVTGKLFMVSE